MILRPVKISITEIGQMLQLIRMKNLINLLYEEMQKSNWTSSLGIIVQRFYKSLHQVSVGKLKKCKFDVAV